MIAINNVPAPIGSPGAGLSPTRANRLKRSGRLAAKAASQPASSLQYSITLLWSRYTFSISTNAHLHTCVNAIQDRSIRYAGCPNPVRFNPCSSGCAPAGSSDSQKPGLSIAGFKCLTSSSPLIAVFRSC